MNRSLIFLLVALVVLLVIYLAVKSARDVTYQPEPFVKMDTARVDGITINAKGNSVNLRKSGSVWQVTGLVEYPAEERFVADLLKRFQGMDIETLSSEDPAKDTLFQVDPINGNELVVMEKGDTLGHFLLGKSSPDNRHTYARKFGERKIYMVKGTFAGQFTRKPKDWRSKVILEMPRENLTRVDFQSRTGGSYALVKQDTLWMLEQGGVTVPTDKPTAERALNTLARFRAVDFIDGAEANLYDFSNPEFSFTVTTTTENPHRISLLPLPSDSNRYCVKKEDVENSLFVIYKGSANAVMLKAEDLKEKAKPETMEMPVSTRTVPPEVKQ